MTTFIFAALLFLPAQDQENPAVFPHSDDSRFWLSGQINIVHQQHPSFPARYTGAHSLLPEREKATSRVLSLYTGLRLTKSTDLLFDGESAGGRGISDAFGLAGFTNLDVVRNPTLGSKPYIARVLIHHVIDLGGELAPSERNFLSLMPEKPSKRIELYFGKFGMADFFDLNAVGGDSHLQFLNWTVDNNGGYDYAADTRGYTYGAIVDYENRAWGLRFAEALMPKVANGIDFEWNISRARAENIELQWLPMIRADRKTTVRFLTYVNHANMGNYREAIDAFLQHQDPEPDLEAHRQQGRRKYGFGVNIDQQLSDSARAYFRWGWNEGHNESFAYTEVNNSAAIGADVQGKSWHRRADKVGLAFASNGISGDHRRYLELGGKGFLLGDGTLTYGREEIIESYYTAHLIHGVSISVDVQHITHPGYNRDRGPVLVPGARLHFEF